MFPRRVQPLPHSRRTRPTVWEGSLPIGIPKRGSTWTSPSLTPHAYSYPCDSSGSGNTSRFTASAFGDLDCGDVYSTFVRLGTENELPVRSISGHCIVNEPEQPHPFVAGLMGRFLACAVDRAGLTAEHCVDWATSRYADDPEQGLAQSGSTAA